ncbi:hypothetical protein [Stenotrophomonas sp.]|uniref:hypothetical protein n=1 Tax=Stenotrophomonas sp. TaxID=69392 RepID=UPI002D6C7F5F|nr:hypothetical protein [Stenotrophomonas sp.]HYQ21903.1 hypothetical protein [Stenotrophomonas sp.]
MRLLRPTATLALLALACGCTPSPQAPGTTMPSEGPLAVDDNPPNAEGKPLLDDLVRTARNADRIVVIEHSSEYDTAEGIHSATPPQERTYRQVVLAGQARQSLIATLEGVDPYVSMWATACIFEPHHRFEFYTGKQRTHTLEVCFQCNELQWDGAKNPVPQALYQDLRPFITSLGMQPERDWKSLAR